MFLWLSWKCIDRLLITASCNRLSTKCHSLNQGNEYEDTTSLFPLPLVLHRFLLSRFFSRTRVLELEFNEKWMVHLRFETSVSSFHQYTVTVQIHRFPVLKAELLISGIKSCKIQMSRQPNNPKRWFSDVLISLRIWGELTKKRYALEPNSQILAS